MATAKALDGVRMTPRTTLFLVVLIALVGSYLWWEERTSQPSTAPAGTGRGAVPAASTTPLRGFFTFEPDQVVQVQMQRGGTTYTATRSGPDWPTPAIGDFLRVLTQVGVIMDISADPLPAAEYGLLPPRNEATLILAGDLPPLVLRIGDRNPPSTGVYVQIGPSGPIGLAGALVDWEFEKAFRGLTPTGTPSARASAG